LFVINIAISADMAFNHKCTNIKHNRAAP